MPPHVASWLQEAAKERWEARLLPTSGRQLVPIWAPRSHHCRCDSASSSLVLRRLDLILAPSWSHLGPSWLHANLMLAPIWAHMRPHVSPSWLQFLVNSTPLRMAKNLCFTICSGTPAVLHFRFHSDLGPILGPSWLQLRSDLDPFCFQTRSTWACIGTFSPSPSGYGVFVRAQLLLHLPSDLAPSRPKLNSQPPRFGFLLASSRPPLWSQLG